MQLWQQPCVWGSWLLTVLAWAGKKLPAAEVGVPQASFFLLVCGPHVHFSKFEQRGNWAPSPCIFSFYTQSYPFLFTWSPRRCFQKIFL